MGSLMSRMDFSKKRTYFLIYTLLFAVMAFLVWSWFFFSGRSFIYQWDGLRQHYTALIYWAQYLREIARTFLEQHTLILPEWDFTIGEGSDILETLQYYVIGDPFALFSVFVPTRFMYVYYDFMIILRLYLAGMAFSGFCFMTGQKSRYAVLAGSITYVFCYWALLNAAKHPYFLNPMLYLPLLLIGVEKIMQGKRPYILILSAFLAGISNFYFFYMLTLLTLIYAIVRLIFTYRKNVKQILLKFLKIAIPAIIGILLAAVILLPMLYTFLGNARISTNNTYHLLYPLSYYSALPSAFLSSLNPYGLCMGFAAPVLPAVILLFRQRGKNNLQKIYFIICLVFILFPFFGQIFNGFSYMTNRWSFAFALICSYIFVQMWPSLMKLTKKDMAILVSGIAIYFVVCLCFDNSRQASTFASIALVLIFILLLYLVNGEKGWFKSGRKAQIALSVLMISIFANSFWFYSYGGSAYATETLEIADIPDELYTNETVAVQEVAESVDEGFYRYSGTQLTLNAGVRAGLSSTQYYWSIANTFVDQFRIDMGLREYSLFKYTNYDDRAALTTLASVLYYVVPSGSKEVPYGFTYVKKIHVSNQNEEDILEELKKDLQVEDLSEEQIAFISARSSKNYDVYRNDNALPLAYTYSENINSAEFESLSAVEKQETILQAVVLEDYTGDSDNVVLNYLEQNRPYTVSTEGNDITFSNDEIVVTKKNSTLTLSIEGVPNAETYVSFEGLDYKWTPQYELYFGDESVDPMNLYNRVTWDLLSFEDKKTIRKERLFKNEETSTDIILAVPEQEEKTLTYNTEDYSWYNDRHDFVINMGYSEEGVAEIKITFSQIGVYSFDSLNVVCQPMDQYEAQVNALKEDTLDKLEIGTDIVSGNIFLDSDKILCLSIPYSTGWEAIVDGEETELYRANIMYMGLPLTAGDHTIQLVYHSPLLRAGAVVSLVGIIILVLVIIWEERKIRRSCLGKTNGNS